jgi:hypothetical protein
MEESIWESQSRFEGSLVPSPGQLAHETLSTIFCSFLSLNVLRVSVLKPLINIMAEKEEVKTDEFD